MSVAAFACSALGARLTPRACGARFRAVKRSRAAGTLPAGTSVLVSPPCVGCAVGAAHARGELPTRWPDGSPIVRLTLAAPAPSIAPKKQRAFVQGAASKPRRRSKGVA